LGVQNFKTKKEDDDEAEGDKGGNKERKK